MKTVIAICLMGTTALAQDAGSRIKALPHSPVLGRAYQAAISISASERDTTKKESTSPSPFNVSESPFQMFARLFNEGVPTKISEFTTYEQCRNPANGFIPWRSLSNNVEPDTTDLEKLKPGKYQVAINFQGLVIKAGEIVPPVDNGPILPGKPGVPEKTMVITNWLSNSLFFRGHCAENQGIGEGEKRELAESHYSFVDTAEGATESTSFPDARSKYEQKAVYHSVNGLIIERITGRGIKDGETEYSNYEGYNYLWRAMPEQ